MCLASTVQGNNPLGMVHGWSGFAAGMRGATNGRSEVVIDPGLVVASHTNTRSVDQWASQVLAPPPLSLMLPMEGRLFNFQGQASNKWGRALWSS
jgi:hypothetical protein